MTVEEKEKAVAQALKNARVKANLSQLDLSYKADVSQNMIAYIESGKRTPTIRTVIKLCDALEINPAVLFEPTDEERRKAKEQIIGIVNKYM